MGLGDAEVDHLHHRFAVVQWTSTLEGLMSRWMIPFKWACWMALQTGTKSSNRSRGVSWCLSQYR